MLWRCLLCLVLIGLPRLSLAVDLIITGTGSGGHTIQEEGVPLAAEPILNFVGPGLICTDNAGATATVCTLAETRSFTAPNLPTIDVDSALYNEVRVSELTSATVNLNAPSGASVDGQRLRYALYSTVSRLLTFTTTANGFAAEAGLNFPARTIAGAYLIMDFRWSAQSQRWALVNVSDRKPKTTTFGDVASITINTNTTELATVALGSATQTSYTINNPTGTPGDGQTLRVRMTTALGAPAKPLIWGSQFTGNAGLPLPTTTTGNGTQDAFGFSRNEVDNTWVMLATTQNSLSARRKICGFPIVTGTTLSDSDIPLTEGCPLVGAFTIEEIQIKAVGAGQPSVSVHRRSGASNTALLTAPLQTGAAGAKACARTAAGTGLSGVTCSATLTNATITTAGDWALGLTSGTAASATEIFVYIFYIQDS